MRIQDIMSQPIITAPFDSTVDAVARLMWEFDCGVIPLIGDDGRLAGIVTDRDICMGAYTQGKPLSAIVASSVMAKDVVCCHAGDAIETTEHLMRDHQIRRVPVLDQENRPIGIVTMNDIARLAARAKKTGVDRELVQTMAAVCKPRAMAQAPKPNTVAPSTAA